MSGFTFQKATKSKAKLRLAIYGPSGAGKTFSALRVANGLGENIALIDTERGSASKYADRFNFSVLDLTQNDIDTYCAAIAAAKGFDVLIIDSLTHAWRELLEEVERIARAKYGGNTWSAWSDGTPKQRRLVDALLGFNGHIIATMRTKTEWIVQQNAKGRNEPRRVGLAPEQGKGIEYEFDMLMEISPEHVVSVTKDRTGKYQDQVIDRPGEELGRELAAWLADGKPAAHWSDDTAKVALVLDKVVEKHGGTRDQATAILGPPKGYPTGKAMFEAADSCYAKASEGAAEQAAPAWFRAFWPWAFDAVMARGIPDNVNEVYQAGKDAGEMKPHLREYDDLAAAQQAFTAWLDVYTAEPEQVAMEAA